MPTTVTTRDRLLECALRLFGERGYAATSVADVAREAGVSHMTFFRYFPTKESVVVADVFDPVIAQVVAAQSGHLPALQRAVHGLVAALGHEDARRELAGPQFRQRIQLAAGTPALRQAVWASGQATQAAIARALVASGSAETASQAAAGAVIGACAGVLLDWAGGAGAESGGSGTADDCLRVALLTLIGEC